MGAVSNSRQGRKMNRATVMFSVLSFLLGLLMGSFGTLAMVIHEDTKHVLAIDGPTASYTTCGYKGKTWPVRSDGFCYMEDMPR